MEISRYDRIVWRINGTLLLLVGLGGLALMSYAFYELFKDVTRDRVVHDVVNVNAQTQEEEYLSLGHFSRIRGTNYLLAPLYASGSTDRYYYSKSSSSERNYLFFNSQTGQSHWLQDNNSSLYSNRYVLHEDPSVVTKAKQKVIAYIYLVVEEDTNGDLKLTGRDKIDVRFSDYRGAGYKTIIEDVDSVLGVEQIVSNEAIVFFRRGEENYHVKVALPSGTPGEPAPLTAILQ